MRFSDIIEPTVQRGMAKYKASEGKGGDPSDWEAFVRKWDAETKFALAYVDISEKKSGDHTDFPIRLMRLSAEAGFMPAQYVLGNIYDEGYGLNRDRNQAECWWRKAAEQGLDDAAEKLPRTDDAAEKLPRAGDTLKPAVPTAKKARGRKNKSKIVAAAIAVVLLALLGVGAIYFLMDSPTDKILDALDAQNYNEALSIYGASDIDDAKLEVPLRTRIDEIKSRFTVREIEYNAAKMELQTISYFGIGSLAGVIDDAIFFVDMMNDSHVAFDYAEILLADGDYLSAVRQYEQVSSESPDYENAQAGQQRAVAGYKEESLAEAQKFADGNEYGKAVAALDAALDNIGNDLEMTQQRDVYIKLDIDEKVAEVLALADGGDYAKAISDLRSLRSAYPNDEQVKQALDDTEAAYIQTILAEANALAKTYKYADAIELLNKSGYATNSDVVDLIAHLTALLPAVLGVDIVPYQSENIVMFSTENPANMMGAVYENGLRTDMREWTSWSSDNVRMYINTNKDYQYVSMLYGPIDESYSASQLHGWVKGKILVNVTMTVWGDGSMLATREMSYRDPIKELTIDIEDITQLIIEFTHNDTQSNDQYGQYAMANVTFSSQADLRSQPNEPVGLYSDSPVLGRDIRAYKVVRAQQLSRAEPVLMMGNEYDYGFVSENTSLSDVFYNLDGKYAELSGTYGPIDGIDSLSGGKISIYGDEELLASYDVTAGDVAKPFSVDVTGVSQLRFAISSTRAHYNNLSQFCLVDMTLSVVANAVE